MVEHARPAPIFAAADSTGLIVSLRPRCELAIANVCLCVMNLEKEE